MKKAYILEIYTSPVNDPEVTFEAELPFMNINIGDLINPATFETSDLAKEKKLLRVVRLEHILWRNGDTTKHKICACTNIVENTEIAQER